MTVLITCICLIIVVVNCFNTSRENYYGNWMTIMSTYSTQEYYDFNFLHYRIFDVVIPGSHHCGMYKFAMDAINKPSTDSYYDVISYLNDEELMKKWSQRQIGTVYHQLLSGSRFLDIRLEKYSTFYYAHNGRLGAELTEIVSDIKQYIDALSNSSKEIIILSLTDYVSVSDTDLASIFAQIVTELNEYMADSTNANYDITQDDIGTLINNNIQIIAFSDRLPSGSTINNKYFYDTAQYFSAEENYLNASSYTTTDIVLSSAIKQLINAGDIRNKLNRIFYNFNIKSSSEITKYHNKYNSFQQYNQDLAVTLRNTIINYPKLHFENVIILDFIGSSIINDMVIMLNYNYGHCHDNVTNRDCPSLTGLQTDYKESSISSSCHSTPSLLISCKRSCGDCQWIDGGMPGSRCTNDAQCNNTIYKVANDVGGATVKCLSNDAITESICSSPYTINSCGSIDSNVCIENEMEISEDCDGCNANYQCNSGYCSTTNSVCLDLATPAPTMFDAESVNQCYCPRVTSDKATQFREDIGSFRPGDANGDYQFEFSSCTDPNQCINVLKSNPYGKSLFGFILIPFILGIILFILYFCCCVSWCFCGNWSKKVCCKCCLKNPNENSLSKWIPIVLMISVLIVIIWACIQGIVSNSSMHHNLFGEHDSLNTEISEMFNSVRDKFEGIGPDTQLIIDDMKSVLNSMNKTVAGTTSGIDNQISDIYNELNYISSTYNNYSLTTSVIEPFSKQTQNVSIICAYCSGLSANIKDINTSFSGAVHTVNDMENTLNDSLGVVNSQDLIDEHLGKFEKMISNFTNKIETYSNDSTELLNSVKNYDEHRETGGQSFFIIPLLWIIFWIIAIVTVKCNKKFSECCFRITWCCAMYVGVGMMILFSFFAIISVSWADLCVNLDEFENDPTHSTLGNMVTSFQENNNSASFDNIIHVVNACWTGGDLLDTFNLTDTLNFDQYKKNLTSALNIDVTQQLSLDELDSFTTEIGLLNTDEFEKQGNEYLNTLNNIDNKCTCNCNVYGTNEAIFTRDKLRNDECYNETACWLTILPDPQICFEAFAEAFIYVNAELDLINQTENAIDDIKLHSNNILLSYDSLFGIAVSLENSLKNITCLIDPIFDKFDSLLTNYSNCGWLGEIYGDFKKIGCVTLFEDMYWISCSMMIIAFLSILVVCFGFMTQYAFHPVQEYDELRDVQDHDELRQLVQNTDDHSSTDDVLL